MPQHISGSERVSGVGHRENLPLLLSHQGSRSPSEVLVDNTPNAYHFLSRPPLAHPAHFRLALSPQTFSSESRHSRLRRSFITPGAPRSRQGNAYSFLIRKIVKCDDLFGFFSPFRWILTKCD